MRVDEERAGIYDALKRHTSDAARLAFYKQLRIGPTSKKKKRRVRLCCKLLLSHVANVALSDCRTDSVDFVIL